MSFQSVPSLTCSPSDVATHVDPSAHVAMSWIWSERRSLLSSVNARQPEASRHASP